jgi:acyl-CoA synthetase (AMP-forming)/AMP-acid ligase II
MPEARGGSSLRGLMQDWPLLCHTALDHAALQHDACEIVTRTVEGPIHRETYAQAHLRARKCAQALARLGVKLGDRVGTLGWNTHRHFEAWYGIMGLGAIYHTLNPRLFPDQIAYIAHHAEDKLILADIGFAHILEAVEDRVPSVQGIIFLTDRAHMPETRLKNVLCYEDLIAAEDGDFTWARLDENTAAGLCYTSGTTGNPKGVLYSHRSNILHSMAINTPDGIGMGAADVMLPVVPMFHANAWALVFAAPQTGTKLVMPGAKLDGESLCELMEAEKVTLAAGVPTVWLGMLRYMQQTGKRPSHLRKLFIGGAAAPRALIEAFEKDFAIEICHAWGMTELSPVGTIGALAPREAALPIDERAAIKAKQGRALYTVEMKITDDDGAELPHDGKTFGHLKVRGPAVAAAYFKGEGGDILDADGFFDTGDIATIDPAGYMQITDRAKDVIKSGGEWISSIEIENAAVGHPAVAEAAVIGVAHERWSERPLLIVALKPEQKATREELLGFLEGKMAKWWLPDDVVFVDEIPHTATGKIQKRELRDRFKDHKLA